ncbi:hypothetical protein [Halomonas sp. M4R1S46]|uniref:hypothetical protein n=1 Tax=Halomonas sp. M4R1S46 TaxID=2982692 RepID=UPI0021E37CF4|nr:hypothetical protein [Halomonas sp. M4R1S46]UYG08376.1 hypothetical protein OCT48_03275 [Halomonas sp. M4R1S46]
MKKEYGLLAPVIAKLESWTSEDAIHAYHEWLEDGGSFEAVSNPVIQWHVWHEDLPCLRERYERGDSLALLKAVERCAVIGLPFPTWCREAYLKSWRKASQYECRTLDEAFDYDMKGINLARARERFLLSVKVASEVRRMLNSGNTVEKALGVVAEQNDISFSRAREWYYELRDDPSVAHLLPGKSEIPRKD